MPHSLFMGLRWYIYTLQHSPLVDVALALGVGVADLPVLERTTLASQSMCSPMVRLRSLVHKASVAYTLQRSALFDVALVLDVRVDDPSYYFSRLACPSYDLWQFDNPAGFLLPMTTCNWGHHQT